jgi:hypothetical protein
MVIQIVDNTAKQIRVGCRGDRLEEISGYVRASCSIMAGEI